MGDECPEDASTTDDLLPASRSLSTIAESFDSNMHGIALFNVRFTLYAYREHSKGVHNFFRSFLESTDIDLGSIFDGTEPDWDIDSLDAAAKQELAEGLREYGAQHPEEIRKHIEAVQPSLEAIAQDTRLLFQGTFATLISIYDVLESALVEYFYRANPQALPDDKGSLTLGDLRQLGSIAAAEQKLIQDEVIRFSYKSYRERKEYFVKKLGLPLSLLNRFEDELVEVFERRNLFMHNLGVVNRLYMAKVPSHLVDESIAEGTQLEIDDPYLMRAIAVIHICGIILVQQAWRKWHPTSLDGADELLISVLYTYLTRKDYRTVIELGECIDSIEGVSDNALRICVVNHAIALKEIGNQQAQKNLISRYDWTACSLKFQVALAALDNDYTRLASLVPRALQASEISKDNLQDWPLLMHYRETPEYAEVMAQLSSQENSIEDEATSARSDDDG